VTVVATVAEFGDKLLPISATIVAGNGNSLSPNSATSGEVTENGDYSRQCGQGLRNANRWRYAMGSDKAKYTCVTESESLLID